MSFRDRFNASKNKAEQKAEEKRQKQEAKQKAAEEKERKKLEDPKYQAKLARKAEKARIAEEKRLVKVDEALTEVFNRLMKDDRPILKAVEKNDGYLKQYLGGFNTVGEYFKTAGGVFVKHMGDVSAEQMEKNKAFQKYKAHMAKEGFNIIAKGGHELTPKTIMNVTKGLSGSLLALSTTGAIIAPPLLPITALALAMNATNNTSTTEVWIKIEEIPPVKAPQPTEKIEEGNLLDEMNQKVVKEPEKVPVQQRNIIK